MIFKFSIFNIQLFQISILNFQLPTFNFQLGESLFYYDSHHTPYLEVMLSLWRHRLPVWYHDAWEIKIETDFPASMCEYHSRHDQNRFIVPANYHECDTRYILDFDWLILPDVLKSLPVIQSNFCKTVVWINPSKNVDNKCSRRFQLMIV